MEHIKVRNNSFIIMKNGEELSLEEEFNGIDIEDEVRKLLFNIEKEVIDEDLTIPKLYTYDGIEMYNFYRGSVVTTLRKIMIIVVRLDIIINKYGNNIAIETDDSLVFDISKDIFKIENIELFTQKKENNTNSINNKLELFKNIQNGIKEYIRAVTSAKEKIVVYSQESAINSINIKGKEEYYDALYGDILNLLKEEYECINFKSLAKYNANVKASLCGDSYIPFDYFKVLKKFRRKKVFYSEKVKNKMSLISKAKYLYKEHDITIILNKKVFSNLESHYINYAADIENWKIILKDMSAKKVIAIDEADRPRCLICAANLLGIESYGIQHGLINQISGPYLIPGEQKFLVPKKTLLWGSKYKDVLMELTNVYNENNLEIIGQPRTDYLYKLMKSKELESEDKENSTVKKILFATQPIEDLAKDSIKMIFDVLSKRSDYEIIIKLHPADIYEDFYYELKEKYNIKNIEITKDRDIYDCLTWCDVVVSVHSTVILEGTILGKKSVCILLKNHYDKGNFVKNGISLGAEEPKILEEAIFSNNNRENLVENNSIKEYFYKIDGEVAKRGKNIIVD